jgi:hypothetical protein
MHFFLFLTISYQLSLITSVYRSIWSVWRGAHYQHVTQFERGSIIGMRETGLSCRAIAHRVGRNLVTVLRCCRAWFQG